MLRVCQCRVITTGLCILPSDIYVEDEWPLRRSYRVEDFLWSGSGDGQQDRGSGNAEDPGGGGSTWRTTTIVRTTTVLTTVYPSPLYTATSVKEYPPQTPAPCSVGRCTPEASPAWPSASIQPTPTVVLQSATVQPTLILTGADRNVSIITPDQRFWLLTVLRVNTSLPEPSTAVLETRLAQLYKTAFRRLAQTACVFAADLQLHLNQFSVYLTVKSI
jgi:hypothetical protein